MGFPSFLLVPSFYLGVTPLPLLEMEMRYFEVFWTVGQKEAILLEQEQAEAVEVVGWGDRNPLPSVGKLLFVWSLCPAGLCYLRFDLWEGGEGNNTRRLEVTCVCGREKGIETRVFVRS